MIRIMYHMFISVKVASNWRLSRSIFSPTRNQFHQIDRHFVATKAAVEPCLYHHLLVQQSIVHEDFPSFNLIAVHTPDNRRL